MEWYRRCLPTSGFSAREGHIPPLRLGRVLRQRRATPREGTTMSGIVFHPEEMDNITLAYAWEITDEGRQYDGVEEDRRKIAREMAKRIRDGIDDD